MMPSVLSKGKKRVTHPVQQSNFSRFHNHVVSETKLLQRTPLVATMFTKIFLIFLKNEGVW